jgi:hypothetical protein
MSRQPGGTSPIMSRKKLTPTPMIAVLSVSDGRVQQGTSQPFPFPGNVFQPLGRVSPSLLTDTTKRRNRVRS